MKLLKLVAILLLVGLGAWFASSNSGCVRFDFYLVEHGVPVVLLVAAGLGVLLNSRAVAGGSASVCRGLGGSPRWGWVSVLAVGNLRGLPLMGR